MADPREQLTFGNVPVPYSASWSAEAAMYVATCPHANAPAICQQKARGQGKPLFGRSRWRALFLCIKAKLESIESGIETFEDAFLAHIQMPDGQSVSDHVRPRIASAYETGSMQPLLPAPKGGA